MSSDDDGRAPQLTLAGLFALTCALGVACALTVHVPMIGPLFMFATLIVMLALSVQLGRELVSGTRGMLGFRLTQLAACGALMVLSIWCMHLGDQRLRRACEEECQPVILALEKYHAAHGTYPNEVKELVPRFLPQLPSRFLKEWGPWATDYALMKTKAGEPARYSLYYSPMMFRYHIYRSWDRSWEEWDS